MDVYIHISSGSGPRECAWVVNKLAEVFVKEGRAEGIKAIILLGDNPSASLAPSLLMKLSGKSVREFAKERIGTIRWIGNSPFRPNHKRKNWFVSVSKAPTISEVPELQERDIQYQTMRATGPGGQHVNTTDSAVRATHVPTNVSVVAREERSQHMNRKLAITKLAMIFADRQSSERQDAKEAMWRQHHNLERGNAVRTYEGIKFKRK
ncbi:peptide chain release factor H [Pseudemcibacter aquimaris]|uniref:peptide chain release factor H n=1 Tax=Pseudemcibacter aquimaris TaxID=2857064 RepID=UPI002012B610|nr:peptide chain release factor H [Pseudemcibacter aquimaris]MCC3860620.1 peptide chain release factor H [Pseudemcibacter aquimaris]WDU59439.1 peptide chain release factor H [Pseudemcibacter aquimaris]